MLGRVSAGAPCYEAFGFLGSGGLGRVYRGVHHPSESPVALKTVRGTSSSAEADGGAVIADVIDPAEGAG